MRYEKNRKDKKSVPPAIEETKISQSEKPVIDDGDEINFSGKSAVDKLQEVVYKAGVRLIPILKNDGMVVNEDSENKKVDLLENVQTSLRELGHFNYVIGFAGEQSCGKSTVINSLLRYPLMPTCKLSTTASVVIITYSEHFRVRAIDEDTQKIVLDFDCEMPKNPTSQSKFKERFAKLLDYGISAMDALTIENFQYFTDITVGGPRISLQDVEMTPEDPKQVMLLLFILLAVNVGQNNDSYNEETKQLMEKRRKIFSYLGIPKDTINLSVRSQGEFDILKSGLVITDLPGLGSNALNREGPDGKKIKGHDDITKEAIQQTDSMVFLATPDNADRKSGYEVLPEMLSSAKLKETICKGDRIIPVFNQVDRCNGEQEIKVAIRKFCNALAEANVEKKPEEIKTYSGIMGEYMFEGFPFERTLFFKREFKESQIRLEAEVSNIDYSVYREIKVKMLRKVMENKYYEESGIEELSQFFRTVYVEIGKYNKSTSTLQAIRAAVMDVVSTLESTEKICNIHLNNHVNIQENLIRELGNAVDRPIKNTAARHSVEITRISDDIRDNYRDNADRITEVYAAAFNEALKKYKKNLNDILCSFKLNWKGLGDKVRIDVAGSSNRARYSELEDEIDNFSISLVDVNKQYEKILKYVRTRIDRFFSDALQSLSSLKGDIQDSLDNCINYASKRDISSEELEKLKAVKDQLIVLVEKQIQVVTVSLNQQQQDETDAMKNILSAIFELNEAMTTSYAETIQEQMKKQIYSGTVWEKREYLLVDGNGGMKSIVNALELSDEDKRNITLNIEAGVNTIIEQKIPEWINILQGIVMMYDSLEKKIKQPMQVIIDTMNSTVEENKDKLETVREQILQWYEISANFNGEVHEALENALIYMNDKEKSNIRLQENIFYDCFNKEVKAEYERVRNVK